MLPASRRAVRFVRSLLPAGEAMLGADGIYRLVGHDRAATLPADDVMALAAAGVIVARNGRCGAAREARSWLRRQLAESDPHATQHRQQVRAADGQLINLAESPLARLAVAAPGELEPFLASFQVEAGERVRRLVERAQLRSHVTMSYDPTRTASSQGSGSRAEISDMAVDARRALADISRVLPPDCAGVVFDVCGLLKGLQLVESERGWPRRSAKLVLRIGLDQLARHLGLGEVATGRRGRGEHAWMEGQRPAMFGP